MIFILTKERELAAIFDTTISYILAALRVPNIPINAKWIRNGITVAGGNGSGNGLNQLSNPWGLYVNNDHTIYIADYLNNRILEWKNDATSGRIVAGGNGPGNRNDQLSCPTNLIVDEVNDCLIICDYNNQRVMRWPRRNDATEEAIIYNVACFDLAIDNNEYLYVSDADKHEVRRWKIGDTNGTVVAGGNGKGNRLDQLNQPRNIFVNQDHSVYVSDHWNHRVMKWIEGAIEGIVVAGNQSRGNSLTQLAYPNGIVVDQLGTVYVADFGNHRVMGWPKGATQGSVVVGGNGPGVQANQFNGPINLSFDQENNLYIVDNRNQRVQKFNISIS